MIRSKFACQRMAAALALSAACALAPAHAQTLRWASQGDAQTMDPHSQNESLTNQINSQVYEPLVDRDRQLNLVPRLAESWQQVSPLVWRLKLRPDVKFHDGTPLTAGDVVFSMQRARELTSQFSVYANALGRAVAVDPLTVEFRLERVNPIFLQHLGTISIMSKAWAERHNVASPQDYNAKQETHAVRNANGTGPYALKSYEQDRRLVLVRNAKWWGWTERAADPKANVTEAIYSVIQSDATRLAALASGEVDFVIDPPFQDVARLRQDPRLKLAQVTDIGIQYLGFDQARPQLQGSDVRDRNPFKDVRVRRAVYQAIDVDTIIAKVLRGQARATGAHLSPLVDGHVPELETRLPYDPGDKLRIRVGVQPAEG